MRRILLGLLIGCPWLVARADMVEMWKICIDNKVIYPESEGSKYRNTTWKLNLKDYEENANLVVHYYTDTYADRVFTLSFATVENKELLTCQDSCNCSEAKFSIPLKKLNVLKGKGKLQLSVHDQCRYAGKSSDRLVYVEVN